MSELEGALVGQWAEQRRDWEPTKEQRREARKKKRRSRRGKTRRRQLREEEEEGSKVGEAPCAGR